MHHQFAPQCAAVGSRTIVLLTLAALMLFSAAEVMAADYHDFAWNIPIDASWTNSTKWVHVVGGNETSDPNDDGEYPDDANDRAFFNHPLHPMSGGYPLTVNLNGNQICGGIVVYYDAEITFDSAVGVNTLSINGSAPVLNFSANLGSSYNHTINCNLQWPSGSELKYIGAMHVIINGSVIGSSGPLRMTSNGKVTLAGNDVGWDDPIYIPSGTLIVRNGVLNSSQDITVDAGSTLEIADDDAWGGVSGSGRVPRSGIVLVSVMGCSCLRIRS